ncbi:MAG: response regulator [bacterium]|jgi:CheY-like chemotaxis protein|nr:response regulator [bacterium]
MRVLIIDDEPSVLEFFSQAARAKGAQEVDTAATGEEALSRVIAGSYDLITVDIRMPGASGLEILSPIRNMCPHAIIAVISGHVPDDFSSEMAGCADLIMHKPINLVSFNKLIEGALNIAQTLGVIRELNEVKN